MLLPFLSKQKKKQLQHKILWIRLGTTTLACGFCLFFGDSHPRYRGNILLSFNFAFSLLRHVLALRAVLSVPLGLRFAPRARPHVTSALQNPLA